MDYINSLTSWFYLHPHWAGIVTFFISLSESLAVIGWIVPGSVMMTAIGALIGSGVLPAWETIVWAILGAVAGDSASYWLGQHYHEQLKRFWPFRTHPQWLERGEAFCLKHGGKSIFIARFVGPVRPIVPVVAGMLNMAPKRFLLVNIISAIAWAPTYMIPGMLLGFASSELQPQTLTRFMFILIGVLLGIWLAAWFAQGIGAWIWARISYGLDKLWERWAQSGWLRPITILLKNPHSQNGHGQLTLGFFLILAVILFILLCNSVIHHGVTTELNIPAWHFFRGLRHPLFEHLMLGITYLGDKVVWLGVIGITCVWLGLKGYWRTLWHWLGLTMLTYGGIAIIKHLTNSPRPVGLMKTVVENSFPSGHTAVAVAMYGFVGILLARNSTKSGRKWILYTVGTIVSLVVLSRLYLGAHWLTDVLGGLLWGVICLMVTTLLYHRHEVSKIPAVKLMAIMGVGLLVAWGGYYLKYAKHDLIDYQPHWETQVVSAEQWWQQETSPVIYRTSRLNSPEEVLNIQWAGKLSTIEEVLAAQGWHKVPKTNLNEIINRIAAKDRRLQLPLLSSLYQDRAPALVMIKKTEDEDLLLVLRLWHSGFHLAQSHMPLWYGEVSYNKLWHRGLFSGKRTANIIPEQPALDILMQVIEPEFKYKWINYTYPDDLRALTNITDDKRVLLVTER